ncbi:MAG: penicillin-binding protein 1A [Desulfobacterales bacterium]|nr:penicillin-binding protein 1A [Desulfobacterales bacterium]
MQLKSLPDCKLALFATVLLGGIIFGSLAGAFFAFTRDLPQIRSLEEYTPSAVTRIYSADNQLLAEIYAEKRDPVGLEDIPDSLKKALITTEDRKFYSHGGVDIKGIARAIVKDIRAGEFVEGASTITQQLTKTLFLTHKKTITRKIKEAILAFQLERRYTKNEILALYLNQVYFGSGAYGVESAARLFFGKPVSDLDLPECALIASLPRAPSRYSPLVNLNLAIRRRNIVLKQMLSTGLLTRVQYLKAVKTPVLVARQTQTHRSAPYFVEYIKPLLEDAVGESRLYKGGLTVITTLDTKLQQAAQKASRAGVERLTTRMARNRDQAQAPQCALVALDVESGGILAMVGGSDFSQSPFNRATRAYRQPGSAFKPLVYAKAVEKGYSQDRLILDAPVAYQHSGSSKQWQPQNYSKDFMGEITLRTALALSKNIPAVRLIEVLGPPAVIECARRLGIRAPLQSNLSLALGTSELTLLELTAAYAVFPNAGKHIKPYGVTAITDSAGNALWRVTRQKTAAMQRADAAVVTDMLRAVVLEGTGRTARALGRSVAGKTGTSNDYRDALFLGFSPTLAAGVWVGRDDGGTLGHGETGARAALPIWIDLFQAAFQDDAFEYFDIPDDTRRMYMHPTTGKTADSDFPGAVPALFRRSNHP